MHEGKDGYFGRVSNKWNFRTVQTGPGAHPASYTMGTGNFPGVKRQRPGVNQPPSRAEVKESVQLYTTLPLGLRGLLLGALYLTLSNRWNLKSVM